MLRAVEQSDFMDQMQLPALIAELDAIERELPVKGSRNR
jgi:hypothetical protein